MFCVSFPYAVPYIHYSSFTYSITMRFHIDTHAIKYLVGFLLVFALRLLPFRPPNVEPVMATLMPFAKQFGALGAFVFGALSIVLFDGVTSGWGVWTLVTALSYGVVGVGAHYFFRTRESRVRNYVGFAIVATLFYDAITGLTIGPLLWHQPFMMALLGQIPFTLLHLAGNITFAAVLSPAIYRWVLMNPTLSLPAHRSLRRVWRPRGRGSSVLCRNTDLRANLLRGAMNIPWYVHAPSAW